MPNFTFKRTKPDAKDYLFFYKGAEVGRCYRRELSNDSAKWFWTIAIGPVVQRPLKGVPIVGYATTFRLAKRDFRTRLEEMVTAGVVKTPWRRLSPSRQSDDKG